jgi:hypothetical protein
MAQASGGSTPSGGFIMTVEYFHSADRSYTQARRHERVPADFLVQIRGDEGRIADHARDFSEGGLGVATTNPLPAMTLVSLRLTLPHHRVPVDVLGRVMWSSPNTMGIRFEQSEPRIHDTLDRMRRDLDRI